MAAKTARDPSGSTRGEERVPLIKLIDKPISFMVLALLIVESLFGGLAWSEGKTGPHTGLLIWTCILFIAGFVLVVVVLAIWQPEALRGTRAWDENYAFRIADDIYSGVEGYLRNLPENDRLEAWQSLSGLLDEEDAVDSEFRKFCQQIAAKIMKKAKIQGKAAAIQGRLAG